MNYVYLRGGMNMDYDTLLVILVKRAPRPLASQEVTNLVKPAGFLRKEI